MRSTADGGNSSSRAGRRPSLRAGPVDGAAGEAYIDAMSATAKVPAKATEAIRRILRKEVGRFGLSTVVVTPGEDHDGDPALFIHARYRRTPRPVDLTVVNGTLHKVRQRLLDLDEERFPYIRHHFADDQKLAGDT